MTPPAPRPPPLEGLRARVTLSLPRGPWLYLAAGFALAFGAVFDPAWQESAPGVCLFRHATGLPCPGCGLSRSVAALLHLDVAAAFAYHPFGPAVAAGMAGLLVLRLAEAATGRRVRAAVPRWLVVLAVGAFGGAWLGWAAWRLAEAMG